MKYDIRLPNQKKGRKSAQDKLIYESELELFATKLQELQIIIAGKDYIQEKTTLQKINDWIKLKSDM